MISRETASKIKEILQGVEVIAYDWDMTSIDSSGKLLQNQAIAAEFGNLLTIDEVRAHWNESTSFDDLMARLTNGADMEKIMEVVRRDYHKLEFAKKAFEFAVPSILEMRQLGHQTALISSVKRDLLDTDADNVHMNLDVLFDFHQAQDDWEFTKPDKRVFNPALQHFGITASRLLYIGDEMKDMRAITDAGGYFIGVESGMSTAEEFDKVGAIHVPTVKEVTQYGTV